MMNIKKISITLRMFQLKVDRVKFILTTLPLTNNVNAFKMMEYENKNLKYSSQLEKYQKKENHYYVLNRKNHQHKVPSILKQLFTINDAEHSFLSNTIKAIFNIYNNSTSTTQYITIASNKYNQFQKLYQRPHHIKASLMITSQNAIQLYYNLMMICQKNINFHCIRNPNNTRKLLQYSDSDFFIFKVESCINLFNNFIIKFINNINSFENYFSFNLNIVLNSSENDINSIQKFNKDLATIILAENNNKNIESKFYSANKFGANFISKCLKIKNFLKGDNTTNIILNINNKMSKVATEQPPIDISKGNTSKNDSITKELSSCGNPSAVGGSGISSSSSSPPGNEKNTLNNIEKHEKGSCFKSSLGDIIQFLELVGGLKHTKRTGFVLRDVKNCESISGHMYRMAMMTFLLDGTEGLNQTKCMELALVHDLAECIVGDLTPFCGVTKEEKKRMEMDAMEKICKLIEPRGKRMWELFVEYENGESPESKFVKDLDRLDMVLQAFEYEKRDNCLMKHQEFFDSTEGKFEHNFVQKLVNEIYDQRNQLAKEYGCTPNMYPQADFLQNGHENNNTENQNDSKIVVNGDVESSSSAVSSSSPSSSPVSTSTTTVPSTVDLDQKKATNGR